MTLDESKKLLENMYDALNAQDLDCLLYTSDAADE